MRIIDYELSITNWKVLWMHDFEKSRQQEVTLH